MNCRLLEGTLSIRDLPEAWHERFEHDFGVVPPDDRDGVLQDVHWYAGTIGGSFQGYTLGNVMGALFYAEALKAHPEIPNEMKQGKFNILLELAHPEHLSPRTEIHRARTGQKSDRW